MLARQEVNKVLSLFGAKVVTESRRNFRKKNASGRGIRSLDFDIEAFEKSFSMTFEMEDYMEFQDKGVSGTEKKYNTPFRYTTKKPPTKVFDRWIIRRGLAARDAQGRFLSRESLKFALSNHIFKFGIKPSLFFTKPFEKHFRNLPDELIEAYGLDVERFMEQTLKDNRKK